MVGSLALHANYPEIDESDIPLGQDCVADQFLLRGKSVHRLQSETGELEDLGMDLISFLSEANRNPADFLSMQPLLQAQREGKQLAPGQVLHAYPPFCTRESAEGVSLAPVPVEEALAYLAKLSKHIRELDDGEELEIVLGK